MRQRWLSGRAIRLHLAVLVWFPGCLVAGWWQVNRAFDGNGLSYLYSVEWPVFAVVGAWAWWALVHTDPEQVGRRAQERMAARGAAPAGAGTADGAGTRGAGGGSASPAVAGVAWTADGAGTRGTGGGAVATDGSQPVRHREDEDEALAAYNDRLAELAARGPQRWRHR